jgi:N-methylhydantoinase A
VQTAAGIVAIADAVMAQILRVVSVPRAYESKRFKLMPFGGAGPLHALAVAVETGMETVLVPPRPEVTSAFGLLVADLRYDFARTLILRIEAANESHLMAAFAKLEAKGRSVLDLEGAGSASMKFERMLDLRYAGQSYHLTIPLGPVLVTRRMVDDAHSQFDEAHFATYCYSEVAEPCELANVRVAATRMVRRPALAECRTAAPAEARRGSRPVWFESGGFLETGVYDRELLCLGPEIAGPAVIEDQDSTTLVHPGWHCRVERYGVLAIRRADV